ncbi:MAG: triose-phosphate isomerase [Nitrospirales bacterium]|nr:triose-phosphate isomerase [Nitrospira sp.]MDR4500241.1 triose-phosphate isomerase [Nitrospirales bacterium]
MLIVGNWKMHKTASEGMRLTQDFLKLYRHSSNSEVVLAPPFTALHAVHEIVRSTPVKLAAQNVYYQQEGAYTGEISPPMLKDLGCHYVILGHSERRQYFAETNDLINQKVRAALAHGLSPILCVGESLEERETGKTHSLIQQQLLEGLQDVTADEMQQVTIAYEPVWAIGTGKAATVEQATEVHTAISHSIEEKWGMDRNTNRVIYGGSVKPDNAEQLFASPKIHGALVGGACLDPESFAKIVSFAQRIANFN